MNTHGHHGVADEAGLPLLKAAFGENERSLGAFYMGNWLTDLSQAVDPVALETARNRATDALASVVDPVMEAYTQVIDQVVAGMFSLAQPASGEADLKPPYSLREVFDVEDDIAELKATMKADLESILQGRSNTRDSVLGEFARNALLVVAYFKFVFPEHAGDDDRMDFESFMRVFGRSTDTRGSYDNNPANDRPGAYTQYYPHEHLDRPEVSSDPLYFAPGPQEPNAPNRVERGLTPGPRSKSRPEKIEPDLYSYLRDDMECTAGLLAEVDDVFTRALENGVDDTDPDWHITLAKLGHALHQVEDFFAHSNWIELAAKKMGPAFIEKVFPQETGNPMFDDLRTIYRKRLTRYVDPVEEGKPQPKPEDEDWVVTGYFDFFDTAVSLAHIAEETLGLKVPDPWGDLFEDAHSIKHAYENRKKHDVLAAIHLREAIELVTDRERALKDPDNTLAKRLNEKLEALEDKTKTPAWLNRAKAERIGREIPMIAATPPEIFTAFVNAVSLGSRVRDATGEASTLFDQISRVAGFVINPVGYVAGLLGERAVNAVKYHSKERLYDLIGARRIGCHSLMAKDHGLEPLYEHQRACATAVHWYVVSTLLRDRSDPQTPDYVDWLELLEYFLRNPLDPKTQVALGTKTYRMVVTDRYVTRKGDQLDSNRYERSLAKRFRRTAAHPRDFDWRTIADANFGTAGMSDRDRRDVINATLRDRSWGLPVKPPNYALKPGVVLNIPGQIRELKVTSLPTAQATWWVQVLERFLERDVEWFPSSKPKPYDPPQIDHEPIKITESEHQALIRRGKDLRRYLRASYRPLDGPGGKKRRPSARRGAEPAN